MKRTIAANYAGRAWTSVVSLLVVPLYMRYIGPEGYGIVAVYASLQMFLNVFDFGLTTTMMREMARHTAPNGDPQRARNTARTLEAGYWAIGIIVAAAIVAAAPLIAHYWLKPKALQVTVVSHAIMLMGAVFAAQWPLSFYTGGVLGLQRLVLLNAVNAAGVTLRTLGAVAVLAWFSPTITAFFIWQLIAAVLHTGGMAAALWWSLPAAPRRAAFTLSSVTDIYGFAAGMAASSVIILTLGQVDKVVLSKLLPLAEFGYYNLALVLANAAFVVSAPLAEVFTPRYMQAAASGSESVLAPVYHSGCQAIGIVAFPISAMLAVFPVHVLAVWTGDGRLGRSVGGILSLLAVGAALNVIMGMLDHLQVALGFIRPGLTVRLAALALLGPLMFVLAQRYHALGAAIAWLVIYVVYVLVTPQIVFARALRHEKARWYVVDVALLFAVSAAVPLAFRVAIAVPAGRLPALCYLLAVGALTSVAAAAVSPAARAYIRALPLLQSYSRS